MLSLFDGAHVVNVKDYGATGNGSTDDAAAIQSAVAAVTGTGGTVYFPPGTYKVGTSIVPANNVALIGSGVGSAVIAPAGTACAVRGNTTRTAPLTRFTMAHLSIDGTNQGPQFGVGIKGVYVQYLAQCQFEDLIIQNCVATGLGIDFLTQGTVIHAVRAMGNGRLNRGGGSGGGSSGIGIGTGGGGGGGGGGLSGTHSTTSGVFFFFFFLGGGGRSPPLLLSLRLWLLSTHLFWWTAEAWRRRRRRLVSPPPPG